jgi:two-component system, LytTR family, sensor kinase
LYYPPHKVFTLATTLFFLGWWLLCAVVQMAIVQQAGAGILQAAADGFISQFIICTAGIILFGNMRFYLPRKEKYMYVLVVSLVFGGLSLLLGAGILKAIYKTDTAYLALFSASAPVRFVITFVTIALYSVLSILWYTQWEQQAAAERKAETEKLARDAELNKLRQQLQPHFLFNSLNSISALAGSQPEKARHMIQQLSDFLRGTLKKEDQQLVSITEEMQYLQLYLDIEKVRFGHRLQTEVSLPETVVHMHLPPLLLQPLVENAIKFGLYGTTSQVVISIAAANIDDKLQVTVTNPFEADTALAVKGNGFGLAAVKRRLYLLFDRNDLLLTQQANQKFTTIITIPQQP